MTEASKESYIDEAKRRIAHLSYKLEQADSYSPAQWPDLILISKQCV